MFSISPGLSHYPIIGKHLIRDLSTVSEGYSMSITVKSRQALSSSLWAVGRETETEIQADTDDTDRETERGRLGRSFKTSKSTPVIHFLQQSHI